MGTVDGYHRFSYDIPSVLNKYPKLKREKRGDQEILAGEIDLIDIHGVYQDTYHIEIHPVPGYPHRFPLLFEVGQRIPRNIEWHIFETDGHCCIRVWAEEIITCSGGITLVEFINTEVVPYFFNQTFRRIQGYYLNERSHGIRGDLEFYSELLNEKNIKKILRMLFFIAHGKEPDRVARCFCGSNKKYRKCHREAFRKFLKLPPDMLRVNIENIFEAHFYRPQ